MERGCLSTAYLLFDRKSQQKSLHFVRETTANRSWSVASGHATLTNTLGTRLMVGQQILDLYVGVRLLRPQPTA